MNTVPILNGAFHALTMEQTADDLLAVAQRGERGWLCTVNVAILMMMRGSPRLQRFVDSARWVVADGQPLIWFSRLMGRALPERVAGVDLVHAICDRCCRSDLGVYLLGATPATLEAASAALRARHPGLRIVGSADGYFPPEEARGRARAVAESGASFLFVAMGVPRQEVFIEEQWEHLGARVAVGLGGSFDVLGGLRRRAPRIVQQVGMEWAFRLAQEPRRLFRRYLVTNLQFLGLAAGEVARAAWGAVRKLTRGG